MLLEGNVLHLGANPGRRGEGDGPVVVIIDTVQI